MAANKLVKIKVFASELANADFKAVRSFNISASNAISAIALPQFTTYDGTTVTDRDAAYVGSDYSCGHDHLGIAYVWDSNILKSSSDEGATWSSALITHPSNTVVNDSISFSGSVYYILSLGAGCVNNVELRKFDGSIDILVYKFPGVKTHSTGGRNNRSMAVSPGGN
ncbi:MAG: hypothetical protein IIC74_02695, partial [Bacteroidetes bacterium]|nr:hypothetical protein [Bacteroidota bacterium]